MRDIAISHLPNCLFTEEDIQAADDIFGLNLGSLENCLVSKQSWPSRDLWSPSFHSQASIGCGPLHEHHVHEQTSILGYIVTQSSLQHGGISPNPSGGHSHHVFEEGDPIVSPLWFLRDIYHL